MMLYPSVNFEINTSLQKFLIGNKKCDATDADAMDTDNDVDGVMLPILSCFVGDTKIYFKKNECDKNNWIRVNLDL